METNEKLELYLNEIISKEAWKSQYNIEFYKSFDANKYRKIITQVTDLFAKLNKGKPKRTLIFDYTGKDKPEEWTTKDSQLADVLLTFGYNFNIGLYKTGFVMKNGKKKSIHDILVSMANRSTPQSKKRLKDQYEKKGIDEIQRQLNFIQALESIDVVRNGKLYTSGLYMENNTNKKIVFTYDHRAIASQSTEVGWTSCMDLKRGGYKSKVGAGASSGVFIAYLVKSGDEYTLESPTARVLFKPYEGRFTGKLYWRADEIHGGAPGSFRAQAQKIVDSAQGKTPSVGDLYDITSDAYVEDLEMKIDARTQDQIELMNDPEKILKMDNPTEEQWKAALSANPKLISKIKNPSKGMQIAAVEAYPESIEWIENPSNETQLAALKISYLLYPLIKNPTEGAKKVVLKNNPGYIKHLDNPSKELQLLTVRKKPNFIQFIDNPSEEVQLEAVKKNSDAYYRISNPTEKVVLQAMKGNGFLIGEIKNPTEEMQLIAVNAEPEAIREIKNPSEKVQLAAVEKEGAILRFIKKPSERVQIAAVKKNSAVIGWIKNPSEKLQLEAVKKNGYAIEHIKNPTEKVQMITVEHNPQLIKHIDNPTKKVQLKVLENDMSNIAFIKNPDKDIQMMAVKHDPRLIKYIDVVHPEVREYVRERGQEQDG